MAKKSKNSELLVHYARTMTPENLSRAANYVGEYVLKGLGALGKIFTAPLTGGPLGPATVVLPKTKELLDAERKLRLAQEELIGKAMTWISPLNYGTALMTGNGLNAKKGEEEVASWSPAWLAAARLGELYVGPKAVKGVKAAPKVVVNTAAKAGVKPAKAAVVAREINRTTKHGVQNINLRPKSIQKSAIKTTKQEPSTSLAFFERKPTKNNIVGASYDYRMEDPKGSMDFLKEFLNRLKIQGLEYTIGGLKLNSKNVLIGLPENIRNYLNENTIERNARAMRLAGYSERDIQMYKDKVNEEMSKIRVGLYSGEDYNAANSGDFGGFFNNEGNFISVNKDAYLKDPKFTPDYVMKHEGRHLIDYRTGMVDELNKILEEAYDKDFLDIPNHEDAGSLKGYKHMNRERVTTNRDARDVLLSSKGKNLLNEHEFMLYASKKGLSNSMVDFLNKIIKYAQPEDIISAVENSNGYGKRYIKYLRENNKLTPDKIELLRLAMMHVGGYAAPIVGGGYTLYNLLNNQNTNQLLEYRKQGGMLELLKKGGQVRKMLTAAGGPLINESTRVEKPVIPKKINKYQLSDDNLWEKTDNSEVHVYPNLRNDRYIQEFFLYDYAPRFKRLNNFASQDYVNAALNIYKNTPINVFNADSNIGGYKTGGERNNYNNFISRLINSSYIPPSIYLNGNFKMNRPTLVHELTHAFRLGHLGITGDARFSSAKRPLYNAINKEIGTGYFGSGYSNSEKNILDNTYNMKGFKMNYDPLWEKGTTNTEVRFRLWKELYDQLGRRPSLEETDKYIKNYDGEKLLRIIKNANAYGQTMYNNGMLINLIKNALINVAQNNSNNAYLLDDQTYYAKQGGKMNTLEFLKNGSGIHIKEKNKGKFTSYCGGKVTDECILKGKNSSNPAIRKRATFADNARHFKHRLGGSIVDGGEIKYSDPLRRIIKKHLTGGKTTFGLKVGNFLNSLAGLTIVNGALSLIKTSADNKKIQADVEAQKAQNLADWALTMKLIIKLNQLERNQLYQLWVSDYLSGRTMDQPSLIVAQHMGYELLNQELAEGKQGLTNKNNQLDAQANTETSSNWGNAIGGILLSGLGVVGDYLSSKGTTTPATTGSSAYKVDSFWTNPTLKTSTPTYSFNTPTLTPPKTNYSFLK